LASGNSPLAYYWRFNGTNLTDGVNVSGASTAQLNIRNASAASMGIYSVVASNLYGASTSLGAPLTVLSEGGLLITFDDLRGDAYGNYGNRVVPNGYEGMNWNNFGLVDVPSLASIFGPSGYSAGLISSNNVVSSFSGLPAGI